VISLERQLHCNPAQFVATPWRCLRTASAERQEHCHRHRRPVSRSGDPDALGSSSTLPVALDTPNPTREETLASSGLARLPAGSLIPPRSHRGGCQSPVLFPALSSSPPPKSRSTVRSASSATTVGSSAPTTCPSVTSTAPPNQTNSPASVSTRRPVSTV